MLDVCQGKFSLSLTSRVTSRPVENIIVSVYLGDNVAHVSATPSGDSRGLGSGNAGGTGAVLGCVGGGTWEFDPNKRVRCRGSRRGDSMADVAMQVLKWVISALTSMENAASLVGSFTTMCVSLGVQTKLRSDHLAATAHRPSPRRHSSSTFRSANTRSRACAWISSRCKAISPTSHSRGSARLPRAGGMKFDGSGLVYRYIPTNQTTFSRPDGQTGCRRRRFARPVLYSSRGNPSSS